MLEKDEAEEDVRNAAYGLLADYIAGDLKLSGIHEPFAYSVIICYGFVIAMSNVIVAPSV